MTDVEALRAHGYVFDSDSDSGKSEFDEEYYEHKPPPLCIHPSQIVFIRATDVERPNTNVNYVSNNNSSDHNDTLHVHNIGIHESCHHLAQLSAISSDNNRKNEFLNISSNNVAIIPSNDGTNKNDSNIQYSSLQEPRLYYENEKSESSISKTVLYQEDDEELQRRILPYMDNADNNDEVKALIKTNKTKEASIVSSGHGEFNTKNNCDSISIISSKPSPVCEQLILGNISCLNTNLAPQIPNHHSNKSNEESGIWNYCVSCFCSCF